MKTIITTGFILATLTTAIVHGHTGAQGIIKERMDAMKAMGDQSKTVADMFKGKTTFNPDAVADAADAFIQHGKQMATLFPDTDASRHGAMTEALPRIWQQWDEFDHQINQFVELSESLKVTVSATDDIGQLKKAFFTTTKSCSACHKQFRKPKD